MQLILYKDDFGDNLFAGDIGQHGMYQYQFFRRSHKIFGAEISVQAASN